MPDDLSSEPGGTASASDAQVTAAAREFGRLVAIMRRLRAPGGCPWDREQTLESLQPFVLEEAYEVLDAIDRGDRRRLAGEIGDFLFEGVFLAQICAEDGSFTVADALRAINEKLVRRHPHVFGRAPETGEPRAPITTPGDVLEQWEQLKAREQQQAGERRCVLAGIPRTLPALLRAYQIGSRVAAVGFDWVAAGDVVDKIEEEIAELRRAVQAEGTARSEEELGDLLFSIANLARKLGIEPEAALRRANEKFTRRFDALEQRLEARGASVHGASLEELEAEWARVKEMPPSD
jgi:MazG family protein